LFFELKNGQLALTDQPDGWIFASHLRGLEDSTGDDEAQGGNNHRENHLCSDVPHVQVLHHKVKQDGITDEKGNSHGGV